MFELCLDVKHPLPMLENSLREIRLEKNVPQIDLAERVEVSRQTIHAIETGKYVPSVELCLKVAAFLDLHMEDIFRLKKRK